MRPDDFKDPFLGRTGCFHLASDHLESVQLFAGEECFRYGVNTLALAAARFRVSILCYELMNSHLHTLLKGVWPQCWAFFRWVLHRLAILVARRDGVSDVLHRDGFDVHAVVDDLQFKRETAYILRNATRNSLIILDEIGRGTSTFDGLAIAWAVVGYICDQEKIGAKTLFATHYHELSELEGHLAGVKNFCISVKEHGEDVIFLRKIIRGGADKSFGVHVARLAGLPKKVIERADAILQEYDKHKGVDCEDSKPAKPLAKEEPPAAMGSLFVSALQSELLQLDVMSMTPIEAMNALYKLQQEAKKESGVL